MGFAGAFTAQANDPSAIFHNAAGIAFLKGKQFYLGGTLIRPSSTFTGADPFPGASVTEKGDTGLLVPPAAYYTQQFSERLVFGVGLHTPFGLTTSLGQPGHVQRPLHLPARRAAAASRSTRPSATSSPTGSRWASGLDVRFSSVSLQRRVPVINPFTQQVDRRRHRRSREQHRRRLRASTSALLAKISDSLSAGVHYRHKVKASYDGAADLHPDPTGNAQLDASLAAAPAPGQPARHHRASTSPAIVLGRRGLHHGRLDLRGRRRTGTSGRSSAGSTSSSRTGRT